MIGGAIKDGEFPMFTCCEYEKKDDVVRVSFHGANMHHTARLSPDLAQELADQIAKALTTMPRVGTLADLGCEVL